MVRQTVEDCLHEVMDVEGFLAALRRIEDGRIERVAIDTPKPSAFAQVILAAQPYAFLDDAPLEERRTQAVLRVARSMPRPLTTSGRSIPRRFVGSGKRLGLSPSTPRKYMMHCSGWATRHRTKRHFGRLGSMTRRGRGESSATGTTSAHEASRDPKEILRGRLEALGPIVSDDPLLLELEREGSVLRGRFEGQAGWCNRRLLARIHRYTLDRLRKEIEPVTASEFLRFLTCWQHVDEEHRLEGPRGVSDVVRQLAGLEVPALAWEANVLPTRVRGYRREWLDELMLSGEIAWGRVWGSAASPIRTTPLCLLPREDMGAWLALSKPPDTSALVGVAREPLGTLSARGAMFPQELARSAAYCPSQLESGISELISARRGLRATHTLGFVRCSSPRRVAAQGLRRSAAGVCCAATSMRLAPPVEMVARQLLRRTGSHLPAYGHAREAPFPLARSLARAADARGPR